MERNLTPSQTHTSTKIHGPQTSKNKSGARKLQKPQYHLTHSVSDILHIPIEVLPTKDTFDRKAREAYLIQLY